VLRVLSPIWLEKGETARRIRQRMKMVFDWAKAKNFRSGDNPVEGISRVLPKQDTTQEHFPALPYKDMGAFMARLQKQEGVAARALELLILTGCRSEGVRGAVWAEIDLRKRVWTIPIGRTKTKKRDHCVPLSNAAIAILKKMPRTNDIIFPGIRDGKPLSDMSLSAVLKRMGRNDITVHGFRSTFRDWASECTDFPRDVCEMALEHEVGNKTELAYRRGDLFNKRGELMRTWEAYAMKKSKKPTVRLRIS
jgi:integrase